MGPAGTEERLKILSAPTVEPQFGGETQASHPQTDSAARYECVGAGNWPDEFIQAAVCVACPNERGDGAGSESILREQGEVPEVAADFLRSLRCTYGRPSENAIKTNAAVQCGSLESETGRQINLNRRAEGP